MNHMIKIVIIFIFSALCLKSVSPQSVHNYKPTWNSIDSRLLPKWYDEAKVGIFLHWGVYSVPSFGTEWFWNVWRTKNFSDYVQFVKKNYPPGFTYQEFAKDFTAEFFNPADWAKLFRNAGAKYVVITSKHHEGFTLWPSTYSYSWNSMDVGPHKDLIGELSKAIRNEGLTFGLYYSLYEWFNPRYIADKNSNFTLRSYVDHKALPELRELIETYKPAILWSDGDEDAPDTYWTSTEFLAWLYNESSVKDTVVTNDRWGKGTHCQHGGFFTCYDKYNPGVLVRHKWENAMTIDKNSWGYRRNAKLGDFLTSYELIRTLIETVSCGGNILINVGPTKDGLIIPIFQERLLDLGKWLSINGEAIYATVPWIYQNDKLAHTWYTSTENAVYAILLVWPSDNVIALDLVHTLFKNNSTDCQLLGGNGENLQWSTSGTTININLPNKASVSSDWAWVLKIINYS